MTNSIRHQCMIYDGPPSRSLPAIVAAVRRSLEAGNRCVYLNSPAMVAGFQSHLYATGVDVQRELDKRSLVLDSSGDHLVDGHFVIDRMIEMLETAVQEALADGYVGLFATGDMTWEFGPEREFAKLLEYEWQLEQLFRRQPALSGICQYHRDLLPLHAIRDGVVSHDGIFMNDTLTHLNPHYVVARTPSERVAAAARPDLDAAVDALLAIKS